MYLKTAIILGVVLILIGHAGCVANHAGGVWPTPRPLAGDTPDFRSLAKPDDTPQNISSVEEPTDIITLRQAFALALLKNPELGVFFWEARAQEAAIIQAGLLPNPTIGADIEDIGGPGNISQPQTTIRLGQLIEMGEKRLKRIQTASIASDLSGWDYETKRIGIITAVSQAFIEVLSAQQRVALTKEMVHLAGQVVETVSTKVDAGKVSPVEKTRSQVAFSLSRIDLERARQELEAARKRLAATWGSTSPLFLSVRGSFEPVSPIPSLDRLTRRLSQNPNIARSSAEILQRKAIIDLEESKVIPDITASGGYRQFNETGNSAFLVGISIPLPILDRNQGKILEARHRLAKEEQGRKAVETRVTMALIQAYQALSIAYTEVTALKTDVLPRAQNIFDAVNEGYRSGKFGLLNVLDAQQTLFNTRSQYLRAVTAYHKAVADVEGIIGERLDVARSVPDQTGDRK